MSSIRVFTFARRRSSTLQHRRVDPSKRELASRDPCLELGEQRLRVRAGQRARLRDGDRLGERPEHLGRHERAVDRQHEADVVRGRPQSRDQPVHRRSLLDPVLQNRKRQLERVPPLPDSKHLVADLAQETPRALGECLPAKARQRLGRPEAFGGAADQEDAAEGRHFGDRNALRKASSSAVVGGGSEN